MILNVHVKPNAKTSEVISKIGMDWSVRLHAPPTEGKANEELIRLLAEELDIPKSRIQIIKGAGSRIKKVEISN